MSLMRLARTKFTDRLGNESQTDLSAASDPRLKKMLLLAWAGLPAMLHLIAGSIFWWQASVLSAVILIPMTLFIFWARSHSPDLLNRRLETNEKLPEQKALMGIIKILSILFLIIPGLEYRWTSGAMILAPANWICLAFLVLAAVSYSGILQVMVFNPWAGRTIRTWPDQKLVRDGPYQYARHPMYSFFIVFLFSVPLGLGSFLALAPAILIMPFLIWRIKSEESFLHQQFPDYAVYCKDVPYRLIPYVW